jgi:hypothetical protein
VHDGRLRGDFVLEAIEAFLQARDVPAEFIPSSDVPTGFNRSRAARHF